MPAILLLISDDEEKIHGVFDQIADPAMETTKHGTWKMCMDKRESRRVLGYEGPLLNAHYVFCPDFSLLRQYGEQRQQDAHSSLG